MTRDTPEYDARDGDQNREAPTEGGASPAPSAAEYPGATIGPFSLVKILGEGSFGVVWLAERRTPIVQRVAIKIIKPGMDSKPVIARFEQERQALAMMEHPYVARVLDAGMAPSGRPYFVMEYVVGEPITAYCDQRRLSVRDRLALFARVCDAVQHAHHKGVIHRDLKPGNILVTEVDGVFIPKVIDFGVAKALSPTLSDHTPLTETGQVIGTLEYMSPEQADMSNDIDTRTDVYSLGVVLYELLVGMLPFDARLMRDGGFTSLRRRMHEEEAPRPSTRLSTIDQKTGETLATRRRDTPDDLRRVLKRELEWIPLRALKKDRSERYATPADMARDIRRYLAGDPIDAAPDSRLYRARKFARRNRVGVIGASAIMLALVVGLLGTGIGLSMALEQKARAEAEASRAERLAKARERADNYLREVFRLSTPGELGRNASPEEMLEKAYSLLPPEGEDPLFLGAARLAIAASFQDNGMPERALEISQRARTDLLESGVETGKILRDLDALRATSLVELRRFEEARTIFSSVRAQTLEDVKSADAEEVLRLDRNLAVIERRSGDPERAHADYLTLLGRATGTLGSNNELTIAIQGDLVSLLIDLGRPEEAVLVAKDALRRSRSIQADFSPLQRIRLLHNAAQAARRTGDAELAADWHQQALELARTVMGLDHPQAALVTANAARSLMMAGRSERAVEVLNECIVAVETMHGEDEPSLVRLLATRAIAMPPDTTGVAAMQADLARARRLVSLHGEARVGVPSVRMLREAEDEFEKRRVALPAS